MNSTIWIILLVVVIGSFLVFTNKSTSVPSSIPTPSPISSTLPSATIEPLTQPSSSTSPSPVTESNTISISNFAFSPATLTIKQGTKVTWINEDTTAHTIKSTTFNSTSMNQGDKFEFVFATKGSFDYSCGIHPSMKGKIVVQ